MASGAVRWGVGAVLAAVAVALWARGGVSGTARAAGDPAALGLPPTMRAVRVHEYGDPHVMQVEELPSPGALGDYEVVVRVDYAGVNPVDWKARRGNLQAIMALPLPFTPGFDFSGTVVAAGAAVTKLRVGTLLHPRCALPASSLWQMMRAAIVTCSACAGGSCRRRSSLRSPAGT